MKSGRGKCPQCKEMIVVDLDLPEIKCPLCGAWLKKMTRHAPETAEEKAEQVVADAPETAQAENVAEEQSVAAENAQNTEPETAEGDSTVAAEVAEDKQPLSPYADEADFDDIPLPAEAMQEAESEVSQADIESFADLDENFAEPQADEGAAGGKATLFGGLTWSDEDEAKPQQNVEVDGVYGAAEGDLSVAEGESQTIAPADEACGNEAEVQDAAGIEIADATSGGIEIADGTAGGIEVEDGTANGTDIADADVSVPGGTGEAESAAQPTEAKEEKQNVADEDMLAALAFDETAFFGMGAGIVQESTPPTPEETLVAAMPQGAGRQPTVDASADMQSAAPAAQEQPAQQKPQSEYTEEDMAFAAALSDGLPRTYVAPKAQVVTESRTAEMLYGRAAYSGRYGGTQKIFSKPVAVLIMLFSALLVLFTLAYGSFIKGTGVYAVLPEKVSAKILEVLPTFGGDYFVQYLTLIYCGVTAIVLLLAMSGHRFKTGTAFLLLADVVYCFYHLWLQHSAKPYFVNINKITDWVCTNGNYVDYIIYGLVFLGAIAILAGLVGGKDEFEFGAKRGVCAIVAFFLMFAGCVAILLLYAKKEAFELSLNNRMYIVAAVFGLVLLLTLVGVHNGSVSRAANGWLLLVTVTLLSVVYLAIRIILETELDLLDGLRVLFQMYHCLMPTLPFIALAAFAASDLRN